jgi:hypothetical protein
MGLRLIWPQRHPHERSAKAVLRAMGEAGVPPRWAKLVLVGGDAASGSKANRRMGQNRAQAETARRWGGVLAIARPWKTVEEKTRQHLVPHVPRPYAQRTQVPREPGTGRSTLWTSHPRVGVRPVGDVTLVLRQKGRNRGPRNPNRLVTHLAAVTPRQVVRRYQKRWAGELRHWERKAGLGLGEHQVRGATKRSEKAASGKFESEKLCADQRVSA